MNLGFKKIENFVKEPILSEIETSLRKFHGSWLVKYEDSFKKGAINSAYLTSEKFLNPNERLRLLQFVSSQEITVEAKRILGDDICFLNTQLFFNPYHQDQKNYWHRDIQYTGMTLKDQRKKIEAIQSEVIHMRIALSDEYGLEFIPKSHHVWDSDQELETRLQQNGRNHSDHLPNGFAVSMKRGDLLIFDANIIHRGLYGMNRFSLDILFCRPLPEITKFSRKDSFPDNEEMNLLDCPEIFNLDN